MNNDDEDIIILKKYLPAIFIFFTVVIGFWGVLLSLCLPYKEVLTCNNLDCSVSRYYLIFNNKRYNEYYFKRKDLIIVNVHCSGRGGCSADIINKSDNDYCIFENPYNWSWRAKKILDNIKGNKNIKITKYWFIEKIQ